MLGIKLSRSSEELPPQHIKNGLNMFEALFNTMKDAHDERYISRKVEKNVIFIPVDEYNTTEFNLSDEMKLSLFQKGKDSATRFLKTW